MTFTEKRELEIADIDGGGSITFERDGTTVQITRAVFYRNHLNIEAPIELGNAERLALMSFLNMGEYRELSHEERR